MTTWSGRVEGALASEVWEFLRADDAELLPYDCEATALHAQRLAQAGILTADELAEVEERARGVSRRTPGGALADAEDVHSAIEHELGEVGRKVHAGRSRNDQVAAALRLYVLDACAEAREAIDALALVCLSLAESEAETAMPGYTHLQRAQPVTFGHHLLAWVEMLDRDRTRFAHAAEAASESPLGAGAVAGSTLDAAACRRARCGTRSTRSGTGTSRSTTSTRQPCSSSTSRGSARRSCSGRARSSRSSGCRSRRRPGSSMMPQKLNPDVAELVRGKAGTAIGRLTGLLATVKGLPLAYDRDLQEDKPPVFAARRDTRLALGALVLLVSALEVDRDRLEAAASDPQLLATDAAEALVREGVPFRDAHEQVAAQVREGSFEPPEAPSRALRAGPRRHSRGAGGGQAPLRRRPLGRVPQPASAAATLRWKSWISCSLSAHEPPLGNRAAVEPLLDRLAEREILLADLRPEVDDFLDLRLGDVRRRSSSR